MGTGRRRSARAMGIYVETLIRAPMDALWEHTQDPTLHERWDLRFSTIEYLPRSGECSPSGSATPLGSASACRSRARARAWGSATCRRVPRVVAEVQLRGSSVDHSRGERLLEVHPHADGIRFLTWYDYQTRFGRAGALFDRVVFRPMLGWATAWSFDRLRLWLERDIRPEAALRQLLDARLRAGGTGLRVRVSWARAEAACCGTPTSSPCSATLASHPDRSRRHCRPPAWPRSRSPSSCWCSGIVVGRRSCASC